jgi:hypothetical protein
MVEFYLSVVVFDPYAAYILAYFEQGKPWVSFVNFTNEINMFLCKSLKDRNFTVKL